MVKKSRLFARRSTQEDEYRLRSDQNTANRPHKNPPTSRLSRRRASPRGQPFWDFVSNPPGSFSNPVDRWWYVGIVILALIGAILGFFSLPDGLFGLNGLRLGTAIFSFWGHF